MSKCIWAIVVVFTLAAGVSAQTTNPNYEVTPFGDPPYADATGRDRDTISVAADGKGSILVLRRSQPPVLVFNRAGELQKAWGTDLFTDTHNIDVDRDGFVWIGDRNGQMVYKFTMDGEQLLALGTKGVRGDNSSRVAFNRPSDVAIAANGDIFVADGYDNNRVVHFSKDGAFIKIIGGTPGSAPGEFEEVHGVQIDSRGRLIVMDGHSDHPRLQVWAQNGTFIEEWADLGLTMGSGLVMGDNDTFYIGDTDAQTIKVVNDGRVIDVIAGLEARPHNIALDAGTGDLYLADTMTPGGMVRKVSKK